MDDIPNERPVRPRPVATPGNTYPVRPAGPVRRRVDHWLDVGMRFIPIGAVIAIGAYIAAQQAVSPQRRVVKLSVLLGLVILMLRVDMVWSVYLFTLLFPFPSGISVGSTNVVLMTLIPLIWAIRATATGARLFAKTYLDAPIVVFLFAYVLSFFNVTEGHLVIAGINVVWRQLACFAYFYMIVNFVDDEQKLMRMLRVLCAMTGLVMLTAIVELLFPGHTIIPGWIGLSGIKGQGTLHFRLEGLRVGGALRSHALTSDLATNVLPIMGFLLYKVRNPAEKLLWFVTVTITVMAMLSTANRGAFIGLFIGGVWLIYLFRRQVSPLKIIIAVAGVVAFMTVAQLALLQQEYAVSVVDRLAASRFEGVVPENRVMTWLPALQRSMEHIFIGHGPYFETGLGLRFQFWPHNAYLYYLYTLGMVGLGSYLWIVWRSWKASNLHREAGIDGTDIGTIMKLLQVWLVVHTAVQMRTDHQRSDVSMFLTWMMFGLIGATAAIIQDRLASIRRGATSQQE